MEDILPDSAGADRPTLLNCPFCGQPPLDRSFLAGHDEGCLFDLMGRRGISQAELDEHGIPDCWNGQRLRVRTPAIWISCSLIPKEKHSVFERLADITGFTTNTPTIAG
jgi:hypothetical protein